MSEDKELGPDELEQQDAELLPERAAMSVIRPTLIDHTMPPTIMPDENIGTGEPAPPPLAE